MQWKSKLLLKKSDRSSQSVKPSLKRRLNSCRFSWWEFLLGGRKLFIVWGPSCLETSSPPSPPPASQLRQWEDAGWNSRTADRKLTELCRQAVKPDAAARGLELCNRKAWLGSFQVPQAWQPQCRATEWRKGHQNQTLRFQLSFGCSYTWTLLLRKDSLLCLLGLYKDVSTLLLFIFVTLFLLGHIKLLG